MSQSALKRSGKIEFPNTTLNNNQNNNSGSSASTPCTSSMVMSHHSGGILRERSFVKQANNNLQQQLHHKRRSHTMASINKANQQTLANINNNNNNNNYNKPTMEIYRPPNVRADGPFMGPFNQDLNGVGKLNVHAKEFTMMGHRQHQHQVHHSKSSGSVHQHYMAHHNSDHQQQQQQHFPLQHSKSGHARPQVLPLILPATPMAIPLMHSASSIIVPNSHYQQRVNFHQQQPVYVNNQMPLNQQYQNFGQQTSTLGLKRSKSLVETKKKLPIETMETQTSDELFDLDAFPEADRKNIATALLDPNVLPSRTLMDIVKVILERLVEGVPNAETCAKLCSKIIDKEVTQTFLESLLNTCQQWYQERDKILRGVKAGKGTRFTAFMWFLTEMCAQSQRYHMKTQFEGLRPDMFLLNLLCKCCSACVTLPIKCLVETECLFFVLTSIGRVLENELPEDLEELMASVRDGFLANAGSSQVRRTLLQLIELHASNWQLPGTSVLYYYPRNK